MRPPSGSWQLAGYALLVACGGDVSGATRQSSETTSVVASPDAAVVVPKPCVPYLYCDGSSEVRNDCAGGQASEARRDCTPLGLSCQPALGCAACQPRRSMCQGNDVMSCRADGSGFELTQSCDPRAGQLCEAGTCIDPCALAATNQSYLGCEYWPTPVLNSQLDVEFEFAVIVANPQQVPAKVTVSLGSKQLVDVEIASEAVRAIPLPWIDALKGTAGAERSALVSPGAYRLRSNLPVSVYQFNPLEYRLDTDCAAESLPGRDPATAADGECFSFSNDASLLLPTPVLAKDYIVVSRPTMLNRRQAPGIDRLASSPGFFTVIGAEPGGVDVTLELSAYVVAASDASIAALEPGAEATVHLALGDVLQVVTQAPDECVDGEYPPDQIMNGGMETRHYCSVSSDYDLTGSEVHATGKVAVISGHNCSFVPYGRWACDHQEEQLFPLQAWGKDYLVSITKPLRDEPNVIRIISGSDANRIHFDPAVRPDLTLARGQMTEFEARSDFRVVGSTPLLVAQFLVGQDYAGLFSAGEQGLGDPSLSLAIPIEQYRTSYSILVPETYPLNMINITAQGGQPVELDGRPVVGFTPVPGTGMATARIEVSRGQHHLDAQMPFGVVSYGFGAYTSYMYPAGLDLKRINQLQ